MTSSTGLLGQMEEVLRRTLTPKRPDVPHGDDWVLWRKACDGHGPSATELVRRLTPQAHGLAMQLLRQTEDAQDVVQESYLRLWSSTPSDARGAQLSTYFNTIVINRCKTHLTRHREFSADSDLLVQMSDAQQQQAEAVPYVAPVTAKQLQQAMSTLPARQRMALAMWAYADADVTDIARTLELEVNAAHQLLFRAKGALRTVLQGVAP